MVCAWRSGRIPMSPTIFPISAWRCSAGTASTRRSRASTARWCSSPTWPRSGPGWARRLQQQKRPRRSDPELRSGAQARPASTRSGRCRRAAAFRRPGSTKRRSRASTARCRSIRTRPAPSTSGAFATCELKRFEDASGRAAARRSSSPPTCRYHQQCRPCPARVSAGTKRRSSISTGRSCSIRTFRWRSIIERSRCGAASFRRGLGGA